MVNRTVSIATLLLGTLAAGCSDVAPGNSKPYVIDDFDDGDILPAASEFDAWTCASFNPDSNRTYECGQGPGFDSAFSAFLDFTITDPPDGAQQNGGASLLTFANKPVDFTGFEQIDFSVMLESQTPPLPSSARLYLELGCSTAAGDQGQVPGDLYLFQAVDYGAVWNARELPLADFGPPPWRVEHIAGGAAGCLARVDSIRFTVDADLPDAQIGRGLLRVDDVRLR
jgi:hypothetical protein